MRTYCSALLKVYSRFVAGQLTVSGALLRQEGMDTMFVLLLLVLLLICVLAPWLGADTSDRRSEKAHPEQGWFPLVTRR